MPAYARGRNVLVWMDYVANTSARGRLKCWPRWPQFQPAA